MKPLSIDMWTDTHCHLFDLSTEELVRTLGECRQAGVLRCLNTGIDIPSNTAVLTQCEQASGFSLFAACGISAEKAGEYPHEYSWQPILEKQLSHPKVIGLGEIGLDGVHTSYPSPSLQEKLFIAQLDMARTLNLPAIIHSRGKEDRVLSILRERNVKKAVFHCFTGNQTTAASISDAGYYLSFSGISTFKNADFDPCIRATDPHHILIETDSPYLSPEPKRGKRNTPAYLPYIGHYIAKILGKNDIEIAAQISQNWEKLFLPH
ncbi:MAG: TatD family hydrolase [Fibrobacterota bacterium]